jgi:hypothetical protein
MLDTLKQEYPNVYILMVAVTMSFWFYGMNLIIGKYVKNNLRTGLVMCSLVVLFFYMDDNSLSELYNIKRDKREEIMKYGAIKHVEN